MTKFTHIIAGLSSFAVYSTISTYMNSGVTSLLYNQVQIMNSFSRVVKHHEIGKEYSMKEIYSVLNIAHVNMENPQSDVGAKQIHKICAENFGENLCDSNIEALMAEYCGNMNNIRDAYMYSALTGVITSLAAGILVEYFV